MKDLAWFASSMVGLSPMFKISPLRLIRLKIVFFVNLSVHHKVFHHLLSFPPHSFSPIPLFHSFLSLPLPSHLIICIAFSFIALSLSHPSRSLPLLFLIALSPSFLSSLSHSSCSVLPLSPLPLPPSLYLKINVWLFNFPKIVSLCHSPWLIYLFKQDSSFLTSTRFPSLYSYFISSPCLILT